MGMHLIKTQTSKLIHQNKPLAFRFSQLWELDQNHNELLQHVQIFFMITAVSLTSINTNQVATDKPWAAYWLVICWKWFITAVCKAALPPFIMSPDVKRIVLSIGSDCIPGLY